MSAERGMPYSEDAEQAVLCAMLMDAGAVREVRPLLATEDFYVPRHRLVFAAMLAVADRGGVVDPLTVVDELLEAGTLEEAGGRAFVGDMLEVVPTAANVRYHAGLVKRDAERRAIIRAALEVMEQAHASTDVQALAGSAVQVFLPIAAPITTRSGFIHISADLAAIGEELASPPPANGIVGIPSGWAAVDEATAGYLGGELIVHAAVPGGGKTVALINMASYNAIKRPDPVPVAFVSAEMSRRALIGRILCDLASVDSVTMRRRTFTREQGHRIAEELRRLHAAPLWIDETPAPSIPALFARIRALKARIKNLALVVVDYMQLLTGMDAENRAEAIRAISYALKGLAKELDVPIVTAAQVNDKDVEKAKGPNASTRPRLSDLQGSSGIRQAADVVILHHRPSMYGETVGGVDVLDFDLAKVRELPTTAIRLLAELQYQRIGNPLRSYRTDTQLEVA